MIPKLILSLVLILFLTLNFLNLFRGSVKHLFNLAFLATISFISFKIYGFGTIFYFLFVLVFLLSIVSLLKSKGSEIFAYMIFFIVMMSGFVLVGIPDLANIMGTLFYLGLFLVLLRGLLDVKE